MNRMHIWVEKEQSEALEILAKKTAKSKSGLIREAIDLLVVQATDLAKKGELVPPSPLQGLSLAIAEGLAKAS